MMVSPYVVLAIVLFSIVLNIVIFQVAKKRINRAHALTFGALAALAEVVNEINAFAREEHRTAESLGSVGSYVREKNSTVRAAKMRGLEVYRNGYVERHQEAIRRKLAEYNENVSAYLETFGEPPKGWVIEDTKESP